MPEPLHPPFLPTASLIPRQLVRWLDINAQNGALTRTATFITLPTFSQAVTWRGYSEIVAAFNFEGPNGFSLKSGWLMPASPNFVACISYRVGNVMTRYALWRNVGEVFNFGVQLYTGQRIYKNFRIEIWSTNSSPAVLTTPIVFYTSVAGILDYRYGVDTTLISNDPIVTNFGDALNLPVLPSDVNNLLLQQYISTVGFASPNWNSQTDSTVISSAGAVKVNLASGSNVFSYIKTTGAGLTGSIIGGTPTANYMFMVLYLPSAPGAGIVYKYNNSPLVSFSASIGTLTIGGNVAFVLNTGILYFLHVDFIHQTSFLNIVQTQQFSQAGLSTSAPTASTTMQILDTGTQNTVGIVEAFAYQTLASVIPIYNYVYLKYGGFPLPLTFPANSIPVAN